MCLEGVGVGVGDGNPRGSAMLRLEACSAAAVTLTSPRGKVMPQPGRSSPCPSPAVVSVAPARCFVEGRVDGSHASLCALSGVLGYHFGGATATVGAAGSRRRFRVRTESVTSVLDSDFGVAAAGTGWVGAWEGVSIVPVATGGGTGAVEGGRVTPVPVYPTPVSPAVCR